MLDIDMHILNSLLIYYVGFTETLIHAEFTPCHGVDFTYQFTDSDNNDETVYVRKRPFLDAFLRRVSEIFEVIIFTASLSCYSEKLLDILDPKGKFFSARRYRSSCVFLDHIYTKDLTVLGIDLAKVCIVDNYPEVHIFILILLKPFRAFQYIY